MDPKTIALFSKLMLQDDEGDLIRFSFPNEERKLKCSISLLSDASPIFKVMFSNRWEQVKPTDNGDIRDRKTIELKDNVNFDQYQIFKLFLEILYGLREIDSLSVDDVAAVYFYAHKYEVKFLEEEIRDFLNERLKCGISKDPFTVDELEQSITFAELYQLGDFKEKLGMVKLAFDGKNHFEFYDLAKKFEMNALKKQVIHHLKTVEPNEDWSLEVTHAVIKCLQKDRENFKLKMTMVRCTCGYEEELEVYCSYCGSYSTMSEIISEM